MAVITVTTREDVVDANDGFTSLREAVRDAGTASTTIKFSSGIFKDATTGPTVELAAALTIASGAKIVIDGRLGFNKQDVTIDRGFDGGVPAESMRVLNVASGADVVIRDVALANGYERAPSGAPGSAGSGGSAGSNGDFGTLEDGTSGGNGGGGGHGGDAPSEDVAVGGIHNEGNLTLERVVLTGINSLGGSGGGGGAGGPGGGGGAGAGGSAVPGTVGPGGSGGSGGGGGNGGTGGTGGDAAAILNDGTLIIRDVVFSHVQVQGGSGGVGGTGGYGGSGGNTQLGNVPPAVQVAGMDTPDNPFDDVYETPEYDIQDYYGSPGSGGDGGSGGIGGAGGDAGAIINRGSFTAQGSFVAAQNIVAGYGGLGGLGGLGGGGGNRPPFNYAGLEPGDSGSNGGRGGDGAEGSSRFVRGAAGPNTATNTFIVEASAEKLEERGPPGTTTIIFAVERLGAAGAAASIGWTLNGTGLTDVDLSPDLSGQLDFSAGEVSKTIALVVVADETDENDEAITFSLRTAAPSARAGFSSKATFAINDSDIVGTALNEKLSGSNRWELLQGLGGKDGLNGRGGGDELRGGGGSDTLDGGVGNDTLDGGDGIDTASYSSAKEGGGVTVSLASTGNLDVGGGQGRDTLRDVENLRGSRFDDRLTGNALGNELDGNDGDDKLFGGKGGDRLLGGDGRDTLDGDQGRDTLQGGDDDDIYIVDAGDLVDESTEGSGGRDTVRSSVTFDLSNSLQAKGAVEDVVLMREDAIDVTGNRLDNILSGNLGANRITGGLGSDTLLAGGQDDGKDVFVWTTKRATEYLGDRVFDFDAKSSPSEATWDRLDLSAVDTDAAAGNQKFRFVAEFEQAEGAEPDGQVRVVDLGKNVRVEIDFNGDSARDAFFVVVGVSALTAADFLL